MQKCTGVAAFCVSFLTPILRSSAPFFTPGCLFSGLFEPNVVVVSFVAVSSPHSFASQTHHGHAETEAFDIMTFVGAVSEREVLIDAA